MSNTAALLAELEREARATRKVLERVPTDKLDWRPHPKSMTLGQLAVHVAGIPGGISRRVGEAGMDASKATAPKQPEPGVDLVGSLDAGLDEARRVLGSMTEEEAATPWRLHFENREVFSVPRAEVVRTMLLNHWYHHRGQLLVYLRLLDVPVPAVYGRSADEWFFGGKPPVPVEAPAPSLGSA